MKDTRKIQLRFHRLLLPAVVFVTLLSGTNCASVPPVVVESDLQPLSSCQKATLDALEKSIIAQKQSKDAAKDRVDRAKNRAEDMQRQVDRLPSASEPAAAQSTPAAGGPQASAPPTPREVAEMRLRYVNGVVDLRKASLDVEEKTLERLVALRELYRAMLALELFYSKAVDTTQPSIPDAPYELRRYQEYLNQKSLDLRSARSAVTEARNRLQRIAGELETKGIKLPEEAGPPESAAPASP